MCGGQDFTGLVPTLPLSVKAEPRNVELMQFRSAREAGSDEWTDGRTPYRSPSFRPPFPPSFRPPFLLPSFSIRRPLHHFHPHRPCCSTAAAAISRPPRCREGFENGNGAEDVPKVRSIKQGSISLLYLGNRETHVSVILIFQGEDDDRNICFSVA